MPSKVQDVHRAEKAVHRSTNETGNGKKNHKLSHHHAAKSPDEGLDDAMSILPDEYTTWLEYTRAITKLYGDYGVDSFNKDERREHLMAEASLLEDCIDALTKCLQETPKNKMMRTAKKFMKEALDDINSQLGERQKFSQTVATSATSTGLDPSTISLIEQLDEQARKKHLVKLKPGVPNVYGVQILDEHTQARIRAVLRQADKLDSKHLEHKG